MILADLHTHTLHSHGASMPEEMFAAAAARGLAWLGLSEHSPRPAGYDYTREYRDKLAAGFASYVAEVRALRELPGPKALLGMEMDWLDGQEAFIRKAIGAHDFDYLVGSVHFLDHWGFDDNDELWRTASDAECFARYERYFELWRGMLASGLFQIAAHPDLIKIFSAERFHAWLARPASQAQIEGCLAVLRQNGMAMEISSAGIHKPCREIYPCPAIMRLAARVGVEISFASDAHAAANVGRDFNRLAAYARVFDFKRQLVFVKGEVIALDF